MAKRFFAGFTLTLVVLALTYTLTAQEKWNITAGAGFPEFVNIGASYQFNQAQAALSGILIPFAEGIIFSVSADYYRHFGGTSKFSVRKPWYLRPNLNFTSSGDKQDYQRLCTSVSGLGAILISRRNLGWPSILARDSGY